MIQHTFDYNLLMKNSLNRNTDEIIENIKKLVDGIDEQFYFATMGGIAVDGYIGKFTRHHPDADFIIFREDLEKAEEVLGKLGYLCRRITHPKKFEFEYKMQTGNDDHLFSFQILDLVGSDNFEISFYRDLQMDFPLSLIKSPVWLELKGVKFPAVSKEFLIKLKENELNFFEKLKVSDPKKYKKRKQKYLITLHDLQLLIR